MAHNGSRSQVNIYTPNSGGAYPFLDLMKSAGDWFNWTDPSTFNANGYPTVSGAGTNIPIPTQAERPGNYVVVWDGNHSIDVGSVTTVSGSTSAGSHRYVFTPGPSDTQIGFNVRFTMVTPSTSIQIFHADDEAALNAGGIFGVKFLSRLQEIGPGVIRFMDWQKTNVSLISQWADRKPVNYSIYSNYEIRPSLYAGVTTNSGDDFSVAFPGFVLADKAKVLVQFNTNASTTSCTLNVAGTGAKPLLAPDGRSLFSTQKPLAATQLACLVYDADLGSWLKLGGDAEGTFGLLNGVPPEIMMALCNQLDCHPWVCIPHLAADANTDYATQIATMFRDGLNPGLIPRFELSNEIWNASGGFFQTFYANVKANLRWSSTGDDYNNWYGRALSLMGKRISDVYSGDRSRYQVICGVWTSRTDLLTTQRARIESTKWVADGGGNTAASAWTTHVCCANYIGATISQDASAEATLADAYVAASPGAAQTAIAETYSASTGVNSFPGVPTVAGYLAAWSAWAAGYGLKLTYYEGGLSNDYLTFGTDFVNRNILRKAAKFVPSANTWTRAIYSICEIYGEFPSCFTLSGANLTWSILDPDVYVTPDPPQWTAVKGFNSEAKPLKFSLTG